MAPDNSMGHDQKIKAILINREHHNANKEEEKTLQQFTRNTKQGKASITNQLMLAGATK